MTGIIILIIGFIINIGFAVFCIKTKSYNKESKASLRIILFVIFSILIIIRILQWDFRWMMLFTILLIQTLLSICNILLKKKKSQKLFKKIRVIMMGIINCLLITFAIIPAILFPQYKPLAQTGNFDIETVSYTLTDPERKESNLDHTESRDVTIQFWYPKSLNEKLPLVVFSHGAFGYRGSNYSTFVELASNGYVVCSIDHTFQSFFTKETDGNVVIANMDFINDAISVQNEDYDKQREFALTHDWLNLRLDDTNFVLNDILSKCKDSASDKVYQLIDEEKIGLFGHSLGGATAAQLGRVRNDIQAVIVVDGTMIGEITGLENEREILNETQYPIPILNLYNEEHFKDALDNSSKYANMVVKNNSVYASQIVIKGSGHLNFTDLPMFSPTLAKLLGTGKVDSRYCIETMNQIILDYFNYYLKDEKELNLLKEY